MKLLTTVLAIAFVFLSGLCWYLNDRLEYERTKPLLLEAGYNPQTGDVMVRQRMPGGDYRGATFRKMCPRSQFN